MTTTYTCMQEAKCTHKKDKKTQMVIRIHFIQTESAVIAFKTLYIIMSFTFISIYMQIEIYDSVNKSICN